MSENLDHKRKYDISCLSAMKRAGLSFCSPFTELEKEKND